MVNFQQKMGENPVEIAHKFGAQKKGLMLTAAQLETARPLLLLWRPYGEGEREGEYGLHMMFTRQRLLAHINY